MHVGADQTGDRPAFERAGQGGLPGLDRVGQAEARVDDDPAFAVPDRPDVHMVQRHGQGKTQPQDALSHLNRLALSRDIEGQVVGPAGVAAGSLCNVLTVGQARLHGKLIATVPAAWPQVKGHLSATSGTHHAVRT